MKKIQVELRITNLDDDISVSQKRPGAIPIITPKLEKFLLDGETQEDQLYKLLINVLACYSTAYEGEINANDMVKWVDRLTGR